MHTPQQHLDFNGIPVAIEIRLNITNVMSPSALWLINCPCPVMINVVLLWLRAESLDTCG